MTWLHWLAVGMYGLGVLAWVFSGEDEQQWWFRQVVVMMLVAIFIWLVAGR